MKTALKLILFLGIFAALVWFVAKYVTSLILPEVSQAATAPLSLRELWGHVYNPTRLKIHLGRIAAVGTIVDATHGRRKDGVRKEADGDCHGWLKLDSGQEELLNAGNKSDEEGNLVFEIVCMFPVTQADAKKSCHGYTNAIRVPRVGTHVRMIGSWVQDDNHAKWNEIHPVESIEVLPVELPTGGEWARR